MYNWYQVKGKATEQDEMSTITIRLEDGTTGTIDAYSVEFNDVEDLVGQKLNIHTADENGNDINIVGVVAEILEA